MSKNDDLVRLLQPCPFCGDPMHAQGGLIRHVEQTEGCPIKQEAWDIGQKDRWNSRAIERSAAQGIVSDEMVIDAWCAFYGCAGEPDKDEHEMMRNALEAAFAATPPAPAPDAGEEMVPCERCQGNGEIVTDWERYRHPHNGDAGDEAVAECPECDGRGEHPTPQPPAVEAGAVASKGSDDV